MGSSAAASVIKIGPAGVTGKRRSWEWWEWDEKGKSNIVQIFISHDDRAIRSIQFQYANAPQNGTLSLSQTHGTTSTRSAYRFDVVKLNHPKEYITRVSGLLGSGNSIASITFGTNHREYGPFGPGPSDWLDNPEPFCFNLGPHHLFYGFYGTADKDGLKSIGLYLNPNNVTTSTTLDYLAVPFMSFSC